MYGYLESEQISIVSYSLEIRPAHYRSVTKRKPISPHPACIIVNEIQNRSKVIQFRPCTSSKSTKKLTLPKVNCPRVANEYVGHL
jgi:hypothetical protein